MTTQNFLEIKNQSEWQALFNKALFKTFFHQPEWESFLESQFKWLGFKHYLWRDELLLSLAEVSFGRGRKKFVSHPFCEYGGPLPLTTGIDFEQFKQDLFNDFQGQAIKISFHPAISSLFSSSPSLLSPIPPFRSLFPPSPPISLISPSARRTFFVENLQQKTERELWLSLRKTTQQEIEKAQKNNLTVAKCENQKELNAFYRLYLAKAREHKIPAYPCCFFEYFFNSPQAEIILAKSGNKVIAGSVFLFYDKCIHYFLNASSREGATKRANHLILWEQMKKYCGQGKIFDLGGTRVGSPLEVFKKGWGSDPQPIVELSNTPAGASRRASKLRILWGFLPLGLIEKLSPRLLKYKF